MTFEGIRRLAPELMQGLRHLRDVLRSMIGIPSYEAYVQHQQTSHPGETILSYHDFFKHRQKIRYEQNINKCC